MGMQRSSVFQRTNFSVDANPNTLLPAFPPGVLPAGGTAGMVEGAPATSPDWYFPIKGALMFAMKNTAGGTSTATVNIWILDWSNPSSPTWVCVKAGLVVTEGNAVVQEIGGAYLTYYVQVTASANTPAGLVAFWISQ
jgi:hypothetical protein